MYIFTSTSQLAPTGLILSTILNICTATTYPSFSSNYDIGLRYRARIQFSNIQTTALGTQPLFPAKAYKDRATIALNELIRRANLLAKKSPEEQQRSMYYIDIAMANLASRSAPEDRAPNVRVSVGISDAQEPTSFKQMARAAEKVLKKVKGDKLPAWGTFDVIVSAQDALARSDAFVPLFNFKISLLAPTGTASAPATPSSRRMEVESQATRLSGLSLGAGGSSVDASGSSVGAGGSTVGAGSPPAQDSVQAGSSSPGASGQASSSLDEEDVPNPNAVGECPICYEDVMGDIFKCCVNARCGRVFHTPCAERWSQQRASCPMCRANWPVER